MRLFLSAKGVGASFRFVGVGIVLVDRVFVFFLVCFVLYRFVSLVHIFWYQLVVVQITGNRSYMRLWI